MALMRWCGLQNDLGKRGLSEPMRYLLAQHTGATRNRITVVYLFALAGNDEDQSLVVRIGA